jgi:hypothetical protein
VFGKEIHKNKVMKDEFLNLNSTINKQGETVTQIIHFKDGIKRTFSGIISESITQGQFTKFYKKDGSMIMINDNNVLCIEVFKEN